MRDANLGNALGAAAGGAVISAGMGYAAVPVAGALIAVAGLALVLLQRASNQRSGMRFARVWTLLAQYHCAARVVSRQAPA